MISRTKLQLTDQILCLTTSCSLLAYLLQFMFPTLAVSIARELGLSVVEVLSWSFGGFLLFGLGALPGGYLADAIGARRALLIGLAGAGVSALAVAESRPGRSLAVCLAALGFFGGFHHPAAMRLLAHLEIGARERAHRLHGIAVTLGLALAPVLSAVLAGRYGSRHAFTIAGFGASGIAAALGMWRTDIDSEPVNTVGETERRSARERRTQVAATAAIAVAGISGRSLAVALPAYVALRVSPLSFGFDTSAVYATSLIGWLAIEAVGSRRDPSWLLVTAQVASAPLLLAMSWTGGVPLLLAATAAVTCSVGLQAAETSLFERFGIAPVKAAGYGARFAITTGVAALAVPLATWSAGSSGDLRAIFSVAAAISATSTVCAALLRSGPERILEPTVGAPARKATVAITESG